VAAGFAANPILRAVRHRTSGSGEWITWRSERPRGRGAGCDIRSVQVTSRSLRPLRAPTTLPVLPPRSLPRNVQLFRPTASPRHVLLGRLWVIKTELVSCCRGKAAAFSKADQISTTGASEWLGVSVRVVSSTGKQISAAPAAITPLQTTDTDDEDRPFAVY
jgi:hypothetical protein